MKALPILEEGLLPSTPLITEERAVAGRYIPRRSRTQFPVPNHLNIALVLIQMAAALTVLYFASRAPNVYALSGLAIVFAFVMQMGFCLAHESVHRKLHTNRKANVSLGVIMFALFPGSLHFFEVAHLLHHRRNRSDDELEDYVLPGENAWIKRVMYFLLISGLFWLLLPLSSIAVALIPGKRIRLPRPAEDAGSFRKFIQFLNGVRPRRVRIDLLVTALIWTAAFPLLHLRLGAIAACYAAFGFSWASQQYIYHVRTPRHAVLGALDLKVWRPIGWLYLNFNYHLTHHLAVWVPWNHLPKIAASHPRQGYWKTYANLWQPPQLLEESWPSQYQTSGPLASKPNMSKRSVSLDLPW